MEEDLDIVSTEDGQQDVVKPDPFVEKATQLGWRPEEDWEGAPEDFIDAKEFVRRQPLFEKIEHQSKAIKNLNAAFEAFKQHHSKVKENEYNRALEQLKSARRRALTDGETDQALMLEDKIDEIKEQKNEFDQQLQETQRYEPEQRPEFQRWLPNNSWYNKDEAMTAFADRVGVKAHKDGYSPEVVLEMVTKAVKTEFKHKFTNPKRDGPSSVEGGTRRGAKAEASDVAGMSEDDVRMMNKIVRSGALSKEDYIKEYKRVQGL